MRKIRAYVDTSVFGGTDVEEFSVASRRFFERIHGGEFIVLISQLTLDELQGAPSQVQQVFKELPTYRQLRSHPQIQRRQCVEGLSTN